MKSRPSVRYDGADVNVKVTFFSTHDVLPKDSTGKILPYASYRVADMDHYGAVAKGKIVDGGGNR